MKHFKSSTLICTGCGCTDAQACPGGCSWVSYDPPVCSACVERSVGSARGDLAARSADIDQDFCPASPIGLHKPIWTSEVLGHCAACRQSFFASEAA